MSSNLAEIIVAKLMTEIAILSIMHHAYTHISILR